MTGMKVLPRYRTWESGVGCVGHGDPTCLCDVVIRESAPVLTTEHKFHNLALHELDDDTVSERNIYEFFSIVLGLFELEQALRGADAPVTRDSWMAMPENVRTALHNHARADSPWEIAVIELEELNLPTQVVREIRHGYSQLTGTIRAKRRKGPVKVRPVMSDEERRALNAKRKREKMNDPAERAKVNARKRAARAKARTGKSWRDAKRTGPTLVPGTYTLEEA